MRAFRNDASRIYAKCRVRAATTNGPRVAVTEGVKPTFAAWLAQTLRAGAAGAIATAIDLATLSILVSGFHVSPHVANIPALAVGGAANFVGNRHFAFRARGGSLARQALGYSVVEVCALALNGLLFDATLRVLPNASHVYWLVRLATSHAVFLLWSYPLWCIVFRPPKTNVRVATSGSR